MKPQYFKNNMKENFNFFFSPHFWQFETLQKNTINFSKCQILISFFFALILPMKKKRLLRARAGYAGSTFPEQPCCRSLSRGGGREGTDEGYPNHRNFFWSVGDG